jgi:hypothetical protein
MIKKPVVIFMDGFVAREFLRECNDEIFTNKITRIEILQGGCCLGEIR